MKKILLSIVLIAVGVTTKAQNICFDTAANASYVRIVPVKVRYNMPSASRLYVAISSTLNQSVTVNWQLKDSVYIDATTNIFTTLDDGAFTVKITDNEISVSELLQMLFLTACDNKHLNLTIK